MNSGLESDCPHGNAASDFSLSWRHWLEQFAGVILIDEPWRLQKVGQVHCNGGKKAEIGQQVVPRGTDIFQVQFSCTWSALQFRPSSCWVLAGGDLVPVGTVSFHGTSHHFQDAIMADPASWTRRVGSSSWNAPWSHGLGLSSVLKVLQNYLA